MKKVGLVIMSLVVALSLSLAFSTAGLAQQQEKKEKKFEKFGEDPRIKEWKDRKFATSNQKFNWRGADPWGGLIFHDMFIHFADSVRAASGGRLDIKVFPTGAIVPAMEIFDATAKGIVDCGHSWPGYWKGKNEAFVAYASVPFGLDYLGYNIWAYERGGQKLLQDLYGKFGMMAFFCGNAGQELGLFSNKKATKMADFKGMKVRTPGWYMDILTRMGISVTPLPGSEIYMALERGIIDACEFSSPAANMPMGFQEITKYVIMPGVHQPSCQFDLFINKKKWDALPADLKDIGDICCDQGRPSSVLGLERAAQHQGHRGNVQEGRVGDDGKGHHHRVRQDLPQLPGGTEDQVPGREDGARLPG